MKKILLLLLPMALTIGLPCSCRMAPKMELGDTVAAKYFEPEDTTGSYARAMEAKRMSEAPDSLDIFYVGEGSTADQLQLVSYPSRRDTMQYAKSKYLKVTGNPDFGHVIRVVFKRSGNGDSIVKAVQEVLPDSVVHAS